MQGFHFKIVPPYDFGLSLKFSQRSRFEIVDQTEDRILKRLLRVGKSVIFARMSCSGTVEKPRGEVSWECIEGRSPDNKKIEPIVAKMLSANLDLGGFYEKAESSKHIGQLAERFRGLKPIVTPTVFESAAWAIMGQQVNLNFAYILKKRLVENFGRKYNRDGQDYFLFPDPIDLAGAKIEALKRLQFSSRKAEYLTGLSSILKNNDSGLEHLAERDYNEALKELMAIRGIGIWSANYILMRGAGHPDCLPLGDSGLHRAIKIINRMKKLPDNAKVIKSANIFKPFRSLYTLYLWFMLMEGAPIR